MRDLIMSKIILNRSAAIELTSYAIKHLSPLLKTQRFDEKTLWQDVIAPLTL
jgi:hypothetical protein